MELRSASGFGASPSGAALPPQPPLHFTVHTVGQQLPHVVAFTDSKLDSRCSLVSHADSGAAINGITVARSDSGSVDVVLLAGGSEELAALRRLLGPTAFIVYWHQGATEDVAMRHQAFQHGANMVTHSELHLNDVLLAVAKQTGGGAHSCSYCGLGGLTPLDLYYHMPLYHTGEHSSRCRRG